MEPDLKQQREQAHAQEAAALDEARASIARGEGIPHEELLRELGLTPKP